MSASRERRWLAQLAALLCLAVLSLGIEATAGTVIAREFRSQALQRQWAYAVYLPTGYETSGLRYPVLYLLHGNNGSLYDWVNFGRIQATADELIASGEIPPAIIVMPDAGSTWYVDRKEKMETAFLQDLIPDVQRHYRALDTRGGRLIGGLSMGGYGSLRFVFKHPDRFAAAALLSPAIYDPEPPETSGARRAGVFGTEQFDATIWKSLNYPVLWDAYLGRKMPVPMYIVSGDDDDFQIESEATRLYERLRRNKQPAELRIVNGAHTWAVWAATIGDAMRYVFRYSSRPMAAEPAQVP